MNAYIKILFFILPLVSLGSCRSARQTSASESVSDEFSVSRDSSLLMLQDSSITTEKSEARASGVVRFAEGGGSIMLVADGSIVLSQVESLHSSRIRSESRKEENRRLELRSEENDSLAKSIIKDTYSESEVKDNPKQGYRIRISVLVFLILLTFICFITWQNLKK